jgi:hypothetical protein
MMFSFLVRSVTESHLMEIEEATKHIKTVSDVVLRAPHHAERDPATGNAVMMERRVVYTMSHRSFSWMKRFCEVPAVGLVRVAGSTVPAECGIG